MKTILLFLLLSIRAVNAANDTFPTGSEWLSLLIASAERSGAPLSSHIFKDDTRTFAYYLNASKYIGRCRAPFGEVHVAVLQFIRSSARGSEYPPPRGHTFVCFFDEETKLRGHWRADERYLRQLSLRGPSKLYFGKTLAFDFMNLPPARQLPGADKPTREVVVDGDVYTIPTW